MTEVKPQHQGIILVVEDSRLLRNVYEVILQEYTEQGFELSIASNGQEALELLEKMAGTGHMPTAILLDLNMPIMGGVDFLKHMRANPFLKSVPVVVLSTESLSEIRRAMREGADDFLRKPFSIEDLRPILEDYIGRK